MDHGGDLGAAIARYGGLAGDWLDLSTGINPHAYPNIGEIPDAAWTRLPSKDGLTRLLAAAREAYRVPDRLDLAAGPGSQAILSWLPRLLPEGDVAILSPTYPSHADIWRRAGRRVHEISNPFALPDECRILVIVNPNNPDGRLVDVKSLAALGEEMTAQGGYLVVDEAFADCMPGASLLPNIATGNIAILRSFGKFFGLAGLRLGFLAGPPALADALSKRLESWSVSGPALAIGTKALGDLSWQARMVTRLADEIADLNVMLNARLLTVFGGTPLYVLIAHRKAEELHQALARRRIWTRIFPYAPTWMRIGLPGSAEALARLEGALVEAQAEI